MAYKQFFSCEILWICGTTKNYTQPEDLFMLTVENNDWKGYDYKQNKVFQGFNL